MSATGAATLGLVILLGAVGSTLVEHLMNVEAHDTLSPESLPLFFSAYYAGVSVLVFTVQTAFVSPALSRFGLGLTMSSCCLVLGAGSFAALLFPGIILITAAYGSASVLYESMFRPAKDVFFTSVPRPEQRRFKLFFDLAPNRLGAALGAGLIALATALWVERLYAVVLVTAITCAGAGVAVASRLSRAYVRNLEESLLRRREGIELAEIGGFAMRSFPLSALTTLTSSPPRLSSALTTDIPSSVVEAAFDDPHLRAIRELRSRDFERVRAVLQAPGGVSELVQYVIPLLAFDPVAEDAVRALRLVAEEHVGALVDALLDPNQPFPVRRRLARAFSECTSQRAVDGLMAGLDDQRFEVRFQCGRSLASILRRNPRIRIDGERIFGNVLREIAVGRPVWEARRLLDGVDGEVDSFADEFLKDRAGQGLAHVFRLLSLVLPAQPLETAYRALHTEDRGLRGTALEYLEGVLPAAIYDGLSSFIGVTPAAPGMTRSRDEILSDLLGSDHKIRVKLEELRRRAQT
jgi:hypothetical protein